MRSLIRLIVLLFLLLAAATLAAALIMVQDRPLVADSAELSHQDIVRARQLLEEHDPRRVREPVRKTLILTAQDLNLLAGYLMSQGGHGSARVTLSKGALAVQATLKLAQNPLGDYLNVDLGLADDGAFPRIVHLRIGDLPVPAALAEYLATRVLESASRRVEYRVARQVVREIHLDDQRVRIVYQWRPENLEHVRERLVPAADRARLLTYQKHLVNVSHLPELGATVTTDKLLKLMFERSQEEPVDADPVAENRALLRVLAAYVDGRDINDLAPEAARLGHAAPHKVMLRGRQDLAQHFLTSAALAATGGGNISDAIGLYKEVSDSRGGSGFSFTDLAADRAGTRFGELATASPGAASALQKRIAAGISEADMMPVVADLPELMPEAEFRRRFGAVDSPAYRATMDDIEGRIAACALYRQPM